MTNDSAGMATVPWQEPSEKGHHDFQYLGKHATCPQCDAPCFMVVRLIGISDYQCARCHQRDPRVARFHDSVARGRRPRFEPGSKAPDPDLTRYPTMKPISNPVAIGDLLGNVLGAIPVQEGDA